MTSVLLVLFLSQARIFMAMSRDGLLPQIFGTVHPRFRTPHVATMLTGVVICLDGRLHAHLQAGRNGQHRHAHGLRHGLRGGFGPALPAARRSTALPLPGDLLVAPLGILVNVMMMLFLPVDSWLRLVVWLAVGLVIYFTYSIRHSHLAKHLMQEIACRGRKSPARSSIRKWWSRPARKVIRAEGPAATNADHEYMVPFAG